MEEICRLCLTDDGKLESIFGGGSGSDLLRLIIYDCTSIQVSRRLGFPSSICEPCKFKLNEYHNFREQCIQNDEYLQTRHLDLEPEVLIKTEPEFNIEEEYEEINDEDFEEWDEEGSNDEIISTMANFLDEDNLSLPETLYLANSKLASPQTAIQITPSVTLHPKIQPKKRIDIYKCEVCEKEFSVLENFQKHITTHKEEKIFQCSYCPKTFHFAKNLSMHVEYIHSKTQTVKLKPFLTTATVQPKSTGNHKLINKQPVTQPTRSTNNGGHLCHVCLRSFREAHNLKQHMSVHGSEKPYKCDICSKSFFNASTLKTHHRIHSDQNPYKCEICTKIFDNARSLELHYRTHTGEKPYSCDVCLKKFSCSSNLKRHRKLHDRDQ